MMPGLEVALPYQQCYPIHVLDEAIVDFEEQ